MTSYAAQVAAAKTAHSTVQGLDAASRQQIADLFDLWDAGKLDNQTIRHKLEAVIRAAYRAAGAIGANLTAQQSGLPDWKPQTTVFKSAYLDRLIKDIQGNLRAYKASGGENRRSTILRMQLSAGAAAEQGYTDGVVGGYSELKDFGYKLHKFWMANVETHVPCPECMDLHGTEVGLNERFADGHSDGSVFDVLQGPPRHPRCECFIVVLIETLENAFDKIDVQRPSVGVETLNTDQVKQMPGDFFKAVVKTLRAVLKKFAGK